jgi:RecA/RadA recombinase
MSKFDFTKTIGKIQSTFKKDERRAGQFGLGDNLEQMSTDPNDYVVMPPEMEFEYHFGVPGIPFGKWVQLSGKPDSGKTTTCLLAIKAAQEQGHAVIYVETERKTGYEDLVAAGVDPNGVIIIGSNITEEIWEGVNTALDALKDDYPDAKILLIIDSYGNTTSMRDSELKFTEKVGMVGGHAKTNRSGVQSIIAKQINQEIAVLVVNYSYANIGSQGETNAGGRALEFACALIIQCSRTGNYEVTRDKVKVKAGIHTRFRVTKNHFAKALRDAEGKPRMLPKDANYRISSKGMEVIK